MSREKRSSYERNTRARDHLAQEKHQVTEPDPRPEPATDGLLHWLGAGITATCLPYPRNMNSDAYSQ